MTLDFFEGDSYDINIRLSVYKINSFHKGEVK